MTDRDIETVLGKLEQHEYGWRATLPESAGRFLGQPIAIDFETRPVPKKSVAPKPSAAEVSLAKAVLAKLPQLLKEAEAQFSQYEKSRKARAKIRDPHIWVSRESFEEEAGSWTFVIGRSDSESFGYHIEFDELECVDMWAGD